MPIRRIGILLAFCFLISSLFAQQSRSELEAAQKQLQSKINLTNKLLNEVSQRKSTSLTHLSLLEDQIKSRRALLLSYKSELQGMQTQQSDILKEILTLQEQSQRLQDQYAGMLQASYRSSLLKNKWLFLLSSVSFQQMFMRWRYLKQINTAWSNQLTQMQSTQEKLEKKHEDLQIMANRQRKLLMVAEQEEKQLNHNLTNQQDLVTGLEKEEQQLKKELKAHAEARRALRSAIEKIIREESAGSADAAELPMTPAMARLAASFQSNKGALPWPVDRGILSKPFGKHRHPTLKNVTTINNGIDIKTEPGTTVQALFEGKVVGQQYIPGYDYMVIISHGSYYTVYSYLASVLVSKGDKIDTAQPIGVARERDGVGEVHLEVWQGRELLDPSQWLIVLQ